MSAATARSGRRAEILEATLRLIGERGVCAVTHRAVAAEAGVPLASTTYHFDSKQGLVREALALVVERSIALATRTCAAPFPIGRAEAVDRLVELSVAQLEGADAPLTAQFELLLEASREPALRPLAERWSEGYDGAVTGLLAAARIPDPAGTAGVVTTALEGALLGELSAPRGRDSRGRLRSLIERLIDSPPPRGVTPRPLGHLTGTSTGTRHQR